MSELKFSCISSKVFYDISKLSLGRNSIASHRNSSKTIPNCVLYEIHLHLVEIIPRQFQIVSLAKFNCISSKLFYDNSKLCLSWNSIAFHWNFSMTIPNCTLAEIPSCCYTSTIAAAHWGRTPSFEIEDLWVDSYALLHTTEETIQWIGYISLEFCEKWNDLLNLYFWYKTKF